MLHERMSCDRAKTLTQSQPTIGTVMLAAIGMAVTGIASFATVSHASPTRQETEVGTRLEQAGTAAIAQFKVQQTEGLLAALQAGKELQQLVKDGRPLDQYPAASPLLALQTSLDNLRETSLAGHQQRLSSIDYSPDGHQVATSSYDGTARLWNLQGKQLAVLKGHQGEVNRIVYRPDGKQVATSSRDGTARLWDLQGKQLVILKGHQGIVWDVIYSPDGTQVATSGSDGTARLWDLQGKQLAVLKGHQGTVWRVVYSPDGKQVATSSRDHTARLWDLQGRQLAELRGHTSDVLSVVYSPDGQRVATSSRDSTARLWDLQGKQLTEFGDSKQLGVDCTPRCPSPRQKSYPLFTPKFKGHRGDVLGVLFTPDGKRVLTYGRDGTLRLWYLWGYQPEELKGHTSDVLSATFSPDGQHIATSSKDGTVRLWDVYGSQRGELKGYRGEISRVVYHPGGNQVAITGEDGIARLWDLRAQRHQYQYQLPEIDQNSPIEIVYSPDSKQLAIGFKLDSNSKDTVQLWNFRDNQLVTLKGHTGDINNITYRPDSQQIATSSDDGTARLWDLQGKQLAVLQGHRRAVWKVMYSPDGKQIATRSRDDARLWDLQGNQLAVLQGDQSDIGNVESRSLRLEDLSIDIIISSGVQSVVYSPDGKQVATSDDRGIVWLWDLKGKQLAKLDGHQDFIWRIVYSPDSQQIATGGKGSALLWDLQGRLLTELKGHQGTVQSIHYSPDSQRVATYDTQGIMRLWDVQGNQIAELTETGGSWSYRPDGKQIATGGKDGIARLLDTQGKLIRELKGHKEFVGSVRYSPDGQQVYTTDGDQIMRIWDLAGRQIAQYQDGGIMSPDWRQLLTFGQVEGYRNRVIRLWQRDDLDGLLGRACTRLQWYLKQKPDLPESDRRLCDDILHQPGNQK